MEERKLVLSKERVEVVSNTLEDILENKDYVGIELFLSPESITIIPITTPIKIKI